MKRTCASCRYFMPQVNGSDPDHCRRNPPALVSAADGRMTYAFPLVARDAFWCGEHRREWFRRADKPLV